MTEIHVEEFEISATEKVSTGDYENATYHATLKGTVEAETQDEALEEIESLQEGLRSSVRKEAFERTV